MLKLCDHTVLTFRVLCNKGIKETRSRKLLSSFIFNITERISLNLVLGACNRCYFATISLVPVAFESGVESLECDVGNENYVGTENYVRTENSSELRTT